jgi:hypothetical protein
MTRHLSKLVIAGLCVTLVALYVVDRRTIQALRAELRARDEAAQRARDDYETKLATLRAEQAERARDPGGPAVGSSLLGQLLNSPALARPQQQESFREIVRTLGLDAVQRGRIETILGEFATTRRDIAARAERAGASIADAPHAEAMRRLRRAALGRVQQALEPGQYAEFLRLGYDRDLGLRELAR